MSGKNSTASICAISGSGPKGPIFQHACSLGQQIHEKEPKLLVPSFTTDDEFFSLIGNPFRDSQYTLYHSLHQVTKLKISDLLEGKRELPNPSVKPMPLQSLWRNLYILAESIVLHLEPSLFFSENNQPKLLPTIVKLWEKYSEDCQSLVEVTIEFYNCKQEEQQPRDSHYSEDQELVGLLVICSLSCTTCHLAINCQHLKSQTSLNVDIYHPLPHPLDDSKTLLINSDYDHLIPKNLAKGICANTQNAELGKKAFSETTCQYLATEGNVTGAEFLEDVSSLYRAIDECGISNLEHIQFVKGMEKQILDRFGHAGTLILMLASESDDMSVVLFIGRAVFGNNFVEQYFIKTLAVEIQLVSQDGQQVEEWSKDPGKVI
ncbi:hypothetical protein BDR26DRAFT_934306 [Obelidium mucronatum]|nr:hypothetical protein BDR26DRAFT_934306 [Obelidium mucronatum]